MARVFTRKVRVSESKAQKRGPKAEVKSGGPVPRSSAQIRSDRRNNLTLADWFEVFAYIDEHPRDTQADIIEHFRRRHNSLIFTQSTLSRKLKNRNELQARANETPNAMSSKRPHAVTHPAVENALALWQKSMENKQEIVTGPMLIAKRAWFEEKFNVPESECLKGKGWLQPFLRNYNIKAIRRHGEAASVNMDAVAQERHRLAQVLAQYAPDDRFNLDETGLYCFAPPDNGLATKQMSGKKTSKFRVTIALVCNATGTEKEELFFIGKSKMPRCFGKISPARRGFYYRNNESAWMTAYLFKEWLISFDTKMRVLHRFVILLVDNFAGHVVSYQPTNIHLEFFAPNMTPFVQPLDAGIIRCFKAIYRQRFCLRAIELDEAGERDIYKISLLEAMCIAKEAWKKVETDTIVNCWKHTQIQGETSPDSDATVSLKPPSCDDRPISSSPLTHPAAWDILRRFAGGDGSLPEVEAQLEKCLASRYVYADWKPAFDAVFQAEDDGMAAVAAIEELALNAANKNQTSSSKAIGILQLCTAETNLMASVNELQKRKRIIGTAPTLEDLLNPIQEKEIGENPNLFLDDNAIVVEINRRIAEENGVESGSDDDDDDDEVTDGAARMTLREGVELCAQLESLCLQHGEAQDILELTRHVRQFRGFLYQKDIRSCKQRTLNEAWGATRG